MSERNSSTIELTTHEACDILRCLFSYLTLAKMTQDIEPKLNSQMIRLIQERLKNVR